MFHLKWKGSVPYYKKAWFVNTEILTSATKTIRTAITKQQSGEIVLYNCELVMAIPISIAAVNQGLLVVGTLKTTM